jgi:hypothetical protein
MTFLVKYVCFHPDNHQGGSGKSFTQECLIEASGTYELKDLKSYLYEQTKLHAQKGVPYIQDSKFIIIEVKTFV